MTRTFQKSSQLVTLERGHLTSHQWMPDFYKTFSYYKQSHIFLSFMCALFALYIYYFLFMLSSESSQHGKWKKISSVFLEKRKKDEKKAILYNFVCRNEWLFLLLFINFPSVMLFAAFFIFDFAVQCKDVLHRCKQQLPISYQKLGRLLSWIVYCYLNAKPFQKLFSMTIARSRYRKPF